MKEHCNQPYVEEIKKAIAQLKFNKAAGTDNFPSPEIVKACPNNTSTIFHWLLESAWIEKTLDDNWKEGVSAQAGMASL